MAFVIEKPAYTLQPIYKQEKPIDVGPTFLLKPDAYLTPNVISFGPIKWARRFKTKREATEAVKQLGLSGKAAVVRG